MTPEQERFAKMLLAAMGDEQPVVYTDCDYDAEDWGVEDDDWKHYDRTDHEASADYWDEIAVAQGGGI